MERTTLVLGRRFGQSLWVGDALLTFEKCKGQLRVVVQAPPEVKVMRAEAMPPREGEPCQT